MDENLRQLIGSLKRTATFTDDSPLRSELLSAERLEEFAGLLAADHKDAGPGVGKRLLPRLEENKRVLVAAYETISEAAQRERTLTPAAEWLIDNFHIVDEQLREIREDLPEGYYRELPKIRTGNFAGYPRIYAIAIEIVSHTDSRLDVDTLKRFIRSYQSVTPLTIGEVWAVAITLRLALVENLRRIAARVVTARKSRAEANAIADKLLEQRSLPANQLIGFLQTQLKKEPDPAFVVQFTQRLRDQDPAIALTLEWLDRQLNLSGKTTEEIVQQEHQRQAAAQVTVANIVTSMRLLSTLDWKEFFESVSLIDPLLEGDPAGAYAFMDFATRDHYRHVIERLSKSTDIGELEVGQRVLDMANAAQRRGLQSGPEIHVGYYLIDRGLPELEHSLGYRPTVREHLTRALLRHPTLAYLGSIGVLTIVALAAILIYGIRNGVGTLGLIAIAILFLSPASDIAVRIMNWAVTLVVKPRPLPKIDLSSSYVEAPTTIVVMPSLLTDLNEVNELLEKLEVHYLANQSEHLHFALLTDFVDAPQEHMPDDEKLLTAALTGIKSLNARYGSPSTTVRFHLFHRHRLWNESERKWMGWERKRGKLHEFNRFLRGADDTTFIVAPEQSSEILQIKYVLTLDADTRLPRGSASRLLGTALHPLNRPQVDASLQRVTRGYGVFQPRITISLESASRSKFAAIFAGNTGVDPYTTAVSDVYQDLFDEGIYTGKGLYELDAFELALTDRVPENSLLSHDLFEGLFARTALVTDIELLDEYPTAYDSAAVRSHRWTRGDWQIADWTYWKLFDLQRLPMISRWKIFDNLRRSVLPLLQLLSLLAAWILLPGDALVYTVFVLLGLIQPLVTDLGGLLLGRPRGVPWRDYFPKAWNDVTLSAQRAVLNLAFLAHQALLMSDAILRTLYRKMISHRLLLQWLTAAQAERRAASGLVEYFRLMVAAPATALVAVVLILVINPSSILVAAPLILAWALSPLIALWISRPIIADQEELTPKEKAMIRRIARSTWRYFETVVGEEDHWLPPDNYQEDPEPVIAHRTSPTNVGMFLLSTIAAHDFGYTATLELIERIELTFTTLERLPRFRGHFFNWYDTRTLEPLTPQYISTVDSGNLAGHLLVVGQACHELVDQPILDRRILAGFRDTVIEMRNEVENLGSLQQQTDAVPMPLLRESIDECALLMQKEPRTVSEWSSFLEETGTSITRIQDIVNALAQVHGDAGFKELRFWVDALVHETEAVTRDLQTLVPWSEAVKGLSRLDETLPIELQNGWTSIKKTLEDVPSPSQLFGIARYAEAQLADFIAKFEQRQEQESDLLRDLASFGSVLKDSARIQESFIARIRSLTRLCDRFLEEMDFHFLFDQRLKVLTIGYNLDEGRRDNSFYDLLASEARLSSFVAIATGDIPQEHWFRLGRQLTTVDGKRALISWSGTMFEYLMPLLVMRNYRGTLLDETHESIVDAQIAYGRHHGIPWGISESAYNARDLHLTYQYGPFGIPGLGLKRGLGKNLVVSPYATMLAAMVRPQAALNNLSRLVNEGAWARLGFYEAIDYTVERVPRNQRSALVRAFMTHHQGMTLVALDNVLHDRIMQRRFHDDARVQADELLLQERIPHAVPTVQPRAAEITPRFSGETIAVPSSRRYRSSDLVWPATQLLSNGTYSVMFSATGGGYSSYRDIGVTRWREDATRDHWGSFCYLRDVRSGALWSNTYQPTARTPQLYDVSFAEDKIEVRRQDTGIATHTELIVSGEDNGEVRRISVTNHSSRPREIELTSYSEIILTKQAVDSAHPAFSNLFVETEFVPEENALLARRRPRSESDEEIWGVHTIAVEGTTVGAIQYETDRSRFLGRGRNPAEPIAVSNDHPLSNTIGPVLDPIFSLRRRVLLQPEETVRITFAIAVAHSRDEAIRLADKYHDINVFDREARLAWTKAQVQMRHLGIDAEEAHLFQELGSRVIYSDPRLRPRPHVLALNSLTQAALWQYGISGDLPIILVRINDARDLRIVRQVLRAHEYLRLKGLTTDLVILNDHPHSYLQELQDELEALARKSGSHHLISKPGGIFLQQADIMPSSDRILLHTVARAVIVTERGSLSDQLRRSEREPDLPPPFMPNWPPRLVEEPQTPIPELHYFNGLGGFSSDGREYLTVLGEHQWTPAPWSNVIGNSKEFGFLVTENGSGFTWSVNSRNNRLTPWSNDTVSDPPGEIFYIRDEDTGAFWTPTPLPIREASPYVVRHGQGYTSFEHTSNEIAQQLLMFVPMEAPVKIAKVVLRNLGKESRRLSLCSYHELVLGTQRGASAPFVISEVDSATGAILARNPYNNEFANRVVFVATSESNYTFTCDRRELIGRNGSPARPAGLRRHKLSGRTGAGLDPCVAIQSVFELAPNEEREIVVLLGETEGLDEARELVSFYRQITNVSAAYDQAVAYWDELLSSVQISTPDTAMDLMVNRWLLYQSLSCRLWSRSAFYQSSGAYGFRDQLQDVMSLCYSKPQLAREQIVRAAGRQFKEGDVQHWWHLPSGRGLRTRCSDDRLWLPLVTSFYLQVTSDASVLDEEVPFLDAPVLEPEQLESYTEPQVSPLSASVFEHCALAIDYSLNFGVNGLPLIGTGDWNDGMNRVGYLGQGESVWLGWFLYKILDDFSVVCDARGDMDRANRYRRHMADLQHSLEEAGWDGDWYLRAFFDDGTPLGSAKNDECRIDSLTQSWAVISGAAQVDRARHAMAAVDQQLVVREDGLIRLLAPPFDRSSLEPGYIKGYVPGVRENGGQYTHAALWTLIAYAMLGDSEKAAELFALLNPINHAATRAGLHKYKVEPYVVAADVYAVVPHQARGGWTWYTGAASWMYRAAVESILGLRVRGDFLSLYPCIPLSWPNYQIVYRRNNTSYEITIENPSRVTGGVARLELDGQQLAVNEIPLVYDQQHHQVKVVLGSNRLPEPKPRPLVWRPQSQVMP